jgi:hypothetical protein
VVVQDVDAVPDGMQLPDRGKQVSLRSPPHGKRLRTEESNTSLGL